MKYFLAFILFLFMMHVESHAKPVKRKVVLYTKEQLYAQGLEFLKENKIKEAADKFQKLSNIYPFSDYGVKALIMSAFLYYLNEDYIDAALSSENYIKFYWQNPELEYMYYLRAMSFFMKIKSEFTNPEYSMKAKRYFMDLIAKFPNSEYKNSSLEKLSEINKILAAYEISIGKFYMKKGDYAAAIPRLQHILKKYNDTEISSEASYRLIESYCILNIVSEAKAHFGVLKKESPQNKWFRHAVNLAKTCNLK